jgi:hypothetical protein
MLKVVNDYQLNRINGGDNDDNNDNNDNNNNDNFDNNGNNDDNDNTKNKHNDNESSNHDDKNDDNVSTAPDKGHVLYSFVRKRSQVCILFHSKFFLFMCICYILDNLFFIFMCIVYYLYVSIYVYIYYVYSNIYIPVHIQGGFHAYGLTTVKMTESGQQVELKQVISARVYSMLVSSSADKSRCIVRQKR